MTTNWSFTALDCGTHRHLRPCRLTAGSNQTPFADNQVYASKRPYGTLDGVVIVNAYHEMTQRVPVLDGIERALKPGGLLVIADSPVQDSTLRTRKEQTARHALALEFARRAKK